MSMVMVRVIHSFLMRASGHGSIALPEKLRQSPLGHRVIRPSQQISTAIAELTSLFSSQIRTIPNEDNFKLWTRTLEGFMSKSLEAPETYRWWRIGMEMVAPI